MKPATPLPWDGGDFAIYDASNEFCIAGAHNATMAEDMGDSTNAANTAYIAHAANASRNW